MRGYLHYLSPVQVCAGGRWHRVLGFSGQVATRSPRLLKTIVLKPSARLGFVSGSRRQVITMADDEGVYGLARAFFLAATNMSNDTEDVLPLLGMTRAGSTFFEFLACQFLVLHFQYLSCPSLKKLSPMTLPSNNRMVQNLPL